MSQTQMIKYGNIGSQGNSNTEKGKAPAFLKNSRFKVNKIHPFEGRVFQLQFSDKIRLPVYSGWPITGETSNLMVSLICERTGNVVESEPESSSKVEIVVLRSDSACNKGGSCSLEDFNSQIVMKGAKSLLGGNTTIYLRNGIGFAGAFYFKHTRNWTRVCEYRLGARMVDTSYGNSVKEAETESFIVKDSRNMNKKHRKLSLTDEVSRLVKIGKDGPRHVLLRKKNIITVKKFLVELSLNPEGLRQILSSKMTSKEGETTIHHAQTCELGTIMHLYRDPNSPRKVAVVFNVVGQAKGLVMEGQYHHLHELPETQKEYAHKLVGDAFQHWDDVISADDFPTLNSFVRSSDVPSDSTKMGSNSVYNFESSYINDGYEQSQETGPSPNINSLISFPKANNFHGYNDSFMPSSDVPLVSNGIYNFESSYINDGYEQSQTTGPSANINSLISFPRANNFHGYSDSFLPSSDVPSVSNSIYNFESSYINDGYEQTRTTEPSANINSLTNSFPEANNFHAFDLDSDGIMDCVSQNQLSSDTHQLTDMVTFDYELTSGDPVYGAQSRFPAIAAEAVPCNKP